MTADLTDPKSVAAAIDVEMRSLAVRNASNERAVRRKYSRLLPDAGADFILDLARELIFTYGYRGDANELIRDHKAAFASLDAAKLEELGQGINSWWTVDSFARNLSGPAWLSGQINDDVIHRWAESDDLWWRRAALVSTVALNTRSYGGYGDTPRTLAVCRKLVGDHEDMVVKGLSWALRELVFHDPEAVRSFLAAYDDQLAARVKREVRNKLETGLKNPRS